MDFVEEVIPLSGRQLVLQRPRDTNDMLVEEAFEHEELLPYWAELWPSGVALARALDGRSLRGARTLELGCGLGAASIVAALQGGRVLATDWSAGAIVLTERNAERNGARLETARCAFADAPRLRGKQPGISCSPATCSTSAETSRCCSTCCRACSRRAARCCLPIPAAPRRPTSSSARGRRGR